jgi:hypothetical protein
MKLNMSANVHLYLLKKKSRFSGEGSSTVVTSEEWF